jgi:8-oxo-dGTP diphosphatase
MKSKPPMILVTAAIIQKDEKILIARRSSHKHMGGMWELPGGKIEEQETPELCLQRELREELGIEVEVGEFFMDNQHNYGDKVVLLKAFFCELINGTPMLHDHDEIKWIEKEDFTDYQFAPADIPIMLALEKRL